MTERGAARSSSLCALVVALSPLSALAQGAPQPAPPPPPRDVAVEDPPIFPLSDVKRGLRGRGYTVFDSALGPEPFEFEVLGVMKSYLGPGEDLIVAELKGEKIERTGVISGMSGSPVYADGKIVGAVGYRFGAFTDRPIAGITPIERMLAVGDPVLAAERPSPAMGAPVSLATSAWGVAEPIAVPISTMGMPAHVLAAFHDELARRGYGPIFPGAGPAARGGAPAGKVERLFASGPIAGLLVDGDVIMAGIGTVTWVKGSRALAFGHPFLGIGSTSMPMSNAWIVTTVASQAGSWKMGQATTPVGTLSDDRLHAIGGDMGKAPDTVKVRVRVDWEGPRAAHDADRELELSVLRHPTDTPLFTALALASGLGSRVGLEAGGTLELAGTARLTSGHTHEIRRSAADPGASLDVTAAVALLQELTALEQQPHLKVGLDSLDLVVKRRAEVVRFEVLAVDAPAGLSPGEEATVRVRVKPFQGAVAERQVKVRVPRGLPAGRYALHAASRKEAQRLESEGGLAVEPVDFESLLRARREAPPDNSLTLYLVAEADGLRIDGQGLPDLPPSLAGLLAEGGGLSGDVLEHRVVRLARVDMGGVVGGAARAKLELDRRGSGAGEEKEEP